MRKTVPWIDDMKKEIGRRIFIKKSAGVTLGAMLLPDPSFFRNSFQTEYSFDKELPESADDILSIDWRRMMKDHDLLWKKIPADMTEAPHFGNGLIGSMIWVDGNSIRLQVFRSDVHDHYDHTYGWTAYSRPRYQIGYFLIKTKGEIIDCDLRQDIYNAELRGSINTSLGNFKIHHLTHRHDSVIYTEIETSGREELSPWKWYPFEAKSSRGGNAGDMRYGQAYAPYKKYENPKHKIKKHKDIYAGVQDLLSGGNYATAWKEKKVKRNICALLISIGNSYPEKTSVDDAINTIRKAQRKIDKDMLKWINYHGENNEHSYQ